MRRRCGPKLADQPTGIFGICRGGRRCPARRKDRVPEVVRAGAERSGHDHNRCGLRRQAEAEAAAPGQRSPAERPERRPLGPLAPCEGRAVRALAQVGSKLRLLGARKRLVQLLRDRQLRLGARHRALELLAQRAAGPEDERLDRARGEAEHLGDLRVRPSLDLAEDDRGPLVEREVSERPADVLGRRSLVVLDELVGDVVVELDLLRSPRCAAEPLQADVVRDLDQPVERRARVLSALERAIRIEERRLRDVLRVGAVAQHPVRVAVHVRRVAPVQPVESLVQPRRSRHVLVDARFSKNLRAARPA
jgi:hypothetical protein